MLKPVAVITSLEDSPPSFDRRLLAAYLRTEYRVAEPPGFILKTGAPLSEETLLWLAAADCHSWAFLTAWNPGSQLLPESTNRIRNRQLSAELERSGWKFFPGLGMGPDGDWAPEESFWILHITAGEAVKLGRKYAQNALLWWESGTTPVLWLLM